MAKAACCSIVRALTGNAKLATGGRDDAMTQRLPDITREKYGPAVAQILLRRRYVKDTEDRAAGGNC